MAPQLRSTFELTSSRLPGGSESSAVRLARLRVRLALLIVVAWSVGCAQSSPADDAGTSDAGDDGATSPVDMGTDPPADAGSDLGVDAYVPPPLVVVSQLAGTLSEPSSTASFTVRLGSAPTSNVALGLASSDPTEGSVGTSSLVFTPSNWNQPQTVELTAFDDDIVDGVVPWSVVLAALVSNDPAFAGFDPTDFPVATSDDDAADLVVTSPTGVLCDFAGMSASFTVVLTAEPAGAVTIPVTTSSTAATVSASSLVFTANDWDVPQTITLTSNGTDVAADTAVAVHLGAPASADPWFAALGARDVDVSLCDLGGRGIVVRAVGGGALANPLITREDGATASFEVSLGGAPAADVFLALSATDAGEVDIAPNSLTFTSSNWATPQVVTLTGIDDGVADGAPDFDVVVAISTSADAIYSSLLPVAVHVKNFPSNHVVADTATASYVNCPLGVTCNNTSIQNFVRGNVSVGSVPLYALPSYVQIDLHQDVLNPRIVLTCGSSVSVGTRSSQQTEYTTTLVSSSSAVTISGIVRYMTLSTPSNTSCVIMYMDGYGD